MPRSLSSFAPSPIDAILGEAGEGGGVTLRKVLGPWQPDRAGHRRDHRHRHLRHDRQRVGGGRRAPRRRAGADGVVRPHGRRLRLHGALLRRVRVDGARRGQRLHVRVRDAGRARRVDHRLGPAARVRHRQHGRRHLVGRATSTRCCDGLGVDLPRWLATDYRSAAKIGGSPGDRAPRRSACPSSSTPWPIFIVALVTIVLVWGVRESARFNAVMVGVKLVVLAFFVFVSTRFVEAGELAPLRAQRLRAASAPGRPSSSSRTSGSTPSPRAPRSARTPGATCPSASSARSSSARSSTSSSRRSSPGSCRTRRSSTLSEEQRAEALAVAMKYVQMPSWMVGRRGARLGRRADGGAPRLPARSAAHPLRHGARRVPAPRLRARCTRGSARPHVSTILTGVLVGGRQRLREHRRDGRPHRTSGRSSRSSWCASGSSILRFRDPGRARPFRVPFGPVLVPGAGPALVPVPHRLPAADVLAALRRLAGGRAGRVLLLRIPPLSSTPCPVRRRAVTF